MFRKFLPLAAGLVGLMALAPGALAADARGDAHDDRIRVWKPYVVEKNCVDGFYNCKVRMDYAPFQRAMVASPGSYWYQKPFQYYSYGDFKSRHTSERGASSHEAWCLDHYRTYDPATDTYVGKGYNRQRCDSPFDGR